MTRNTLIEIVIAIVLLGIAVLFVNPFQFWMPDMAHMLMLGGLFIAFAAFAALVLREQAKDEREEAHRMLSGRAAFLVGASILVIGIAVQGVTSHVDPWLVVTLCGMVVTKLGMRIYGDWRL